MTSVITLPALQRYRLLGIAAKISEVLLLMAIPVLLTTASLRFVINLPQLYEYGFDKYDISHRIGISDDDLNSIAGEIRDYFNSDEEFISIRAVIFGEERELFTQREIEHMRDVKGLVQGVYLWQWITLGYALAFVLSYVAIMKRGAVPTLAKRAFWGGALTLVLLAILGLAVVVGFDSLFLKFHQLGFSNDLWQLNPQIHNLIVMFPQAFFFDATILVALLTIGLATLLIGIGGGYVYWRHRNSRLSEPPPVVA